MNQEQMKMRTKEFAKRVFSLCRQLPTSREGQLIGTQFFRAGTSVGANYRSACRARSKADFVEKLGIVLEETDESLYWLEILAESKEPRPQDGALKPKFSKPKIEIPKSLDPEFLRP